jgi:hypothetical protein
MLAASTAAAKAIPPSGDNRAASIASFPAGSSNEDPKASRTGHAERGCNVLDRLLLGWVARCSALGKVLA